MIDLGEIEKIETYIARVTLETEKIGYFPRVIDRYAFDTIASSMMSKSLALARACIVLLKSDLPDEAYGLSRSIVECALILRFLTSDPALQSERATQFAEFSFDYKNLWLYHARNQFAGKPEIDDIERHAREWNLSGDPKKAKKHWSKIRSFTWDAQSLTHPLDSPSFDHDFKEKQYAVDYFQTCQWVHCSQPALDNYVPNEGVEFRFGKSSKIFGNPSHSVLYIILIYLHSVIGYALFGLKIDRPTNLDLVFTETLNAVKPLHS